VLVMNPEDENVLPFITELKNKIAQPAGMGALPMSTSYAGGLAELAALGNYHARLGSSGGGVPGGRSGGAGSDGGAPARAAVSQAKLEGLQALQMPFELKALEVCLDSVRHFGGC
jgi:hypothetical protein